MIRLSILSKNSCIEEKICHFLETKSIHYYIQSFNEKVHADIYVIEIEKKEDLKIIKNFHRYEETLCYIIGPQNYELASECIKLKVNLYLSCKYFEEDFTKNQTIILKDIQERFLYYNYSSHGIISQMRLSQIYYVESLRHQIIIHSINGVFVERKNLNIFLKEVNSKHFIQIHKSFVVNKQWVKNIQGQECILKNSETLPIGRRYKSAL